MKYLADRHTATFQQQVLTDFLTEGHFERHLRRARTSNERRRATLLGALNQHLGDRVSVEGANAGLHMLVWLEGVRPSRLEDIARRAAAGGVGVYPVTRYYLRPPTRAGLLLGYAAMTEPDIRVGIKKLAAVIP